MGNALSPNIYMPNFNYIIIDYGEYSNPLGNVLSSVFLEYKKIC